MDDERLTAADAAALVGVKPDTWYAYVTRGQAPAADGRFGRTLWWWRSTVVAWNEARPGPGARTDRYAPELRRR